MKVRKPPKGGPSEVLRYSHVGLQFAIILVASILGGHHLDRRLATGGALTLLGTFLGAAAAFYVLYRETRSPGGPGPGSPDPDDTRPGGGGDNPHGPAQKD